MENFQPKSGSRFLKVAVLIGKIVAALVILDITWALISIFLRQPEERYLCAFTLVFIILPTTFIIFFRKKFIARHPKFLKTWKILRIIYAIIIILVIAVSALGYYRLIEKNKTNKAIDFINSQRITLGDVMGKNLPDPKGTPPDQKLNDSTISGIDANKNGIRDDVELAIFKKYPNSAKTRSAELQYAQALQLELTQVFNSETLVAVMQKESYGVDCIGKTGPDVSLKDTHDKIVAALAVSDDRIKEIDNLVINTDLRKKQQSDVYKKYMTSYASLPGSDCDIESSSLSN